MYKSLFCLLGLVLLSVTVFCQEEEILPIMTKNVKRSYALAEEQFNAGKYEVAKKQLLYTIKLKENHAVAHRTLGSVYAILKEREQAIEAFETSFDLYSNLSRAAYFECAELYFFLGDYQLAAYHYQKYIDLKEQDYANKGREEDTEFQFDRLLPARLKSIEYVQSLGPVQTDSLAIALPLGNKINTSQSEFIPTVNHSGEILLFTRSNAAGNQDIYRSFLKDGHFKYVDKYNRELNTGKNEGMPKLSALGNKIYFAACLRADSKGSCDIYQGNFEDGMVAEVENLPGQLNCDQWDSQPSISCDGQRLYFASTRPGGLGGSDIWISQKDKEGNWALPINAGPSVNTAKDEEAPYISNDGSQLFFSSDGHPGYGNGDIYVSKLVNQHWSAAQNLGLPFNSSGKEIGFFIHADNQTAYFSSERPGGQGGLDLYRAPLPEVFRPQATIVLSGKVQDKFSKKGISTLVNISRKEDVQNIRSDENGFFSLCLPANKAYSFQAEAKGYEYLIEAKFISASGYKEPSHVTLELIPNDRPTVNKDKVLSKELKEEKRLTVYFDSDKYLLSELNKQELKEIALLLKEQKQWKAEVVGHTDHKGSADYNKWLSKQRAKSIVLTLKEEGVSESQIEKVEGQAHTQANTNNFDTALMRRVDVVIYR